MDQREKLALKKQLAGHLGSAIRICDVLTEELVPRTDRIRGIPLGNEKGQMRMAEVIFIEKRAEIMKEFLEALDIPTPKMRPRKPATYTQPYLCSQELQSIILDENGPQRVWCPKDATCRVDGKPYCSDHGGKK